jgi:hypothetical protein
MRMSCVSQWFGCAVVTFPVTVAYGDELRHANLFRSATNLRLWAFGEVWFAKAQSPKPKARSSEPNVSRECNSPMA